jgi:hypothetical protein
VQMIYKREQETLFGLSVKFPALIIGCNRNFGAFYQCLLACPRLGSPCSHFPVLLRCRHQAFSSTSFSVSGTLALGIQLAESTASHNGVTISMNIVTLGFPWALKCET